MIDGPTIKYIRLHGFEPGDFVLERFLSDYSLQNETAKFATPTCVSGGDDRRVWTAVDSCSLHWALQRQHGEQKDSMSASAPLEQPSEMIGIKGSPGLRSGTGCLGGYVAL